MVTIVKPPKTKAVIHSLIKWFVFALIFRLIALPLGRYLKIKETVVSKPAHNEVLENFYKKSKRVPSHRSIEVSSIFHIKNSCVP